MAQMTAMVLSLFVNVPMPSTEEIARAWENGVAIPQPLPVADADPAGADLADGTLDADGEASSSPSSADPLALDTLVALGEL